MRTHIGKYFKIFLNVSNTTTYPFSHFDNILSLGSHVLALSKSSTRRSIPLSTRQARAAPKKGSLSLVGVNLFICQLYHPIFVGFKLFFECAQIFFVFFLGIFNLQICHSAIYVINFINFLIFKIDFLICEI